MNQNPQQRQYLEGQNIDHEKIEIPGQKILLISNAASKSQV